MSADILERLDFMLISRRSDEDAIIRDARAEIRKLREKAGELAIARSNDIAEIDRLRGEVEQLRVQLAGCGVIAMCNTRESLAKQMPERGAYGWSVSLEDCRNAVEREMALRERLESTAPAMPNGVEGLVAEWEALIAHPDTSTIMRTTLENVVTRLRAADNRDAAGVVPAWIATWMADREILPDDDGDGISEGALVEALNNHERELLNAIPKAPAAVHAGEAVAVVFTNDGTSEAQFIADGERLNCPRCGGSGHVDDGPQPADGEAVALWISRHWREDLGRDSVVSMVNREDPAHTLRIYVSTTQPAAPVQAAPQEGEASRELVQARGDVTLTASAWGRKLAEGSATRKDAAAFDDAVERLERAVLAAHHSACELGAVRELVKVWRIAVNGASTTNKQDLRPERFIRELEAALQHRGDSRGGEASGG